MRCVVVVLLTLSLTQVVGANPTIDDSFCLDMGGGTNCIWPYPGQVITATVYLEPHHWCWWPDGIRGASFRLERTFGGQRLGQTNFLGGLSIGNPDIGWDIVAGADCVEPDANGVIVLGQVQYLYEGPPGLLRIRNHPTFQRLSVVGCNYQMRHIDESSLGYYQYGGVGVVAPWGCLTTPVALVSWGTIKALYR